MNFLPDPFRDQVLQFTGIDQCAHQCQCFGCNGEAEMSEARSESGNAQYTQGVFSKRRRYMAQYARLQIVLAAIRIN